MHAEEHCEQINNSDVEKKKNTNIKVLSQHFYIVLGIKSKYQLDNQKCFVGNEVRSDKVTVDCGVRR